ncbi:MAG TPA: SBBP repeat-containing protein, partial [Thermodesulfobacteriota bacterium]|nr:SBBP repeat-containing protein [Thermodesulfobacteriota bacterium]
DLFGTNAGGNGTYDIFVAKFDPAGNKVWGRQIGTDGEDYSNGIAVDASGNIYVTGAAQGDLGGHYVQAYDMFLAKFDSLGNKVWVRQMGTTGNDYGYGVATDGGGNIYVTGITDGALDANPHAGFYDFFLAKYDAGGARLWTRQAGTPEDDYGYGVVVDAAGSAYVTGTTKGSLSGNSSAGGWDIFLAKFDSAGIPLWTRQAGTANNDYGNAIAADAAGNIFVTGSTSGALDGNNAGADDMFLMKYDSTGRRLWARQLGTPADDYGYGAAVTSGGKVFVAGATQGDLDGNMNQGGSDLFVLKYDSEGVKK